MAFKFDAQGTQAFWAATGLAGLCLLLVLVDGGLALSNQSARQEVNRRQLSINEWVREARLNQELIQMLAVASARSNDTAIRDLLARNGITFSVNQSTQGTTPSAGAANPAQHKP